MIWLILAIILPIVGVGLLVAYLWQNRVREDDDTGPTGEGWLP